jgi:hypothetical protein
VPSRSVSAASGRPRKFRVSGRLDISIANSSKLAKSGLELHAVCDKTAALTSIPVTFSREGASIRFEAIVDPQAVFAALGEASTTARLRLTYSCTNFSWQTELGREEHRPGAYEVSFTADNRLLLSHAHG